MTENSVPNLQLTPQPSTPNVELSWDDIADGNFRVAAVSGPHQRRAVGLQTTDSSSSSRATVSKNSNKRWALS